MGIKTSFFKSICWKAREITVEWGHTRAEWLNDWRLRGFHVAAGTFGCTLLQTVKGFLANAVNGRYVNMISAVWPRCTTVPPAVSVSVESLVVCLNRCKFSPAARRRTSRLSTKQVTLIDVHYFLYFLFRLTFTFQLYVLRPCTIEGCARFI